MSEPRPDPELLARALAWVARLPLLGDRELGELLGAGEREAARCRRELERRGWVEWVMPDSLQLQPRRRSLLRMESGPELAELLGRPPHEFARQLAVRPREILGAVAAAEAAAGVSALLAGLAREPGGRGLALADARRLPQDRREPPRSEPGAAGPSRERYGAADFWYPRGVAAYGCLRAGGRVAPFFVAWDRAGAPFWYRRRLLSFWEAFRAGESPWGLPGPPPVVIAAAGERELGQWRAAALRRGPPLGPPPALVLATVADLGSGGPGGALWRTPGDPRRQPLARRLDWRPPGELPAAAAPHAWGELSAGPPRREASGPELRRRARALRRPRPGRGVTRLRRALLTLATDADEKRIIEYVGRNPLLDGTQLGALLDLPPEPTWRRLKRLLRLRVLAPAFREETGKPQPVLRFLLGSTGLRWLAARDGVPFSLYARYGAAIGLDGSGALRFARPTRVYRNFEHTLGVNRVLVRLAVDARASGVRLAEWHPEAAAERRFALGDGRSARICPDGAGVLVRGADVCPFLLEYERGNQVPAKYGEKLAGYRDYFALERWRADFARKPLLLFACANDRVEARVVRVAEEWSPHQELLLAPEWRYWAGRRGGILGPVWRSLPQPADDDEIVRDTLFAWHRDRRRAAGPGVRPRARAAPRRPAGPPGRFAQASGAPPAPSRRGRAPRRDGL